MENLIKRTIAFLMVILMSFSVIAYVGSNDFTVSAASAKTISIKKAPTVKANNIKATSVKLKWSKTKGATSYRVYKSTNKKKWTLVAKTNKTSYTVKKLNGNKKYYFKVRAYDSTGKKLKKSPYSKVITVKTKKNETVYAKKNVNIRKKSNTNSAIIAVLKKGKSIKRTGYAKNGWSKVIYKGKTCYISSDFLTATNPNKQETTTKPTTTQPTTEKNTDKKNGEYATYNGKKYPVYVDSSGKKYFIVSGVRLNYITPTVTGEVTAPTGCSVCGKSFDICYRCTEDYYCGACKRTIKAFECHSAAHYDKYR